MKTSIYFDRILSDPNYVLGLKNTIDLSDQWQNTYSKVTEEVWEKTAGNFLYYRRSDGAIWADEADGQIVPKTGGEARLEEMIRYVKALADLPFLVLHESGIVCTKAVGQKLEEYYLGLSQWMEFYLLHNNDVFLEMNPICKNHYTHRAVAHKSLYAFIQEVYTKAGKNEFCRWAKSFSPGQIWFCCLIEWCFESLQDKGIIPGGKLTGKIESAGNTTAFVQLAREPGKLKMVYQGDNPVEKISPYAALMETALKLSEQNVLYANKKARKKSSYVEFLRSLSRDANYCKNNPEMKREILSTDRKKLDVVEQGQQVKRTRSRKTAGMDLLSNVKQNA